MSWKEPLTDYYSKGKQQACWERFHNTLLNTFIFSFCARNMRRASEREDLHQNLSLALWEAFTKLECCPKNPQAFALVVARRALVDYFRKHSKHDLYVETYVNYPDNSQNPLEGLEMKQKKRMLLTYAKEHCNDQQLQIVLLTFNKDWTRKQIARELGLPESTVQTTIRRFTIGVREHFRRKGLLS